MWLAPERTGRSMTTVTMARDAASDAAAERRAYAKVTRRLLPLLFLCYVLAYLDRVNIGVARLQMVDALKFSETVYGLGAGVFFIGYFLFEIPSNLILHHVGARRWIARIMISWGLLSAATMFVVTPAMFYAMRFLLGVAEAGFFPGIIFYLTYWYPAARRARITALFMTAVPLAGVIGNPLSGWILERFAGVHGLAGWQWMFLIEGLPSVLLGVIVLVALTDEIDRAAWLSEREKSLLAGNVAADAENAASHSFRDALGNARVWLLGLVYFGIVMGLYGIGFWLPTLVKATGVEGALNIGLLSSVPYAAASVVMILAARSADRHRERRWHLAAPCALGAVGLVASAVYAAHTIPALLALTMASAGIMAALPLFWSCPTAFLRGAAAAGGIALINSLGNLAGFVSPYMVGLVKDLTQSTDVGLYVLASCLAMSAVLVILGVPARLVDR
jgi:D-galactonate transporter